MLPKIERDRIDILYRQVRAYLAIHEYTNNEKYLKEANKIYRIAERIYEKTLTDCTKTYNMFL